MHIRSVQLFRHLSCRNLCAGTRSFSLRRCTSALFNSVVIYLVAISVQVHAASRCVDAHPLRSALSSSILSQSLCKYTQLLAASMHIRSVQPFRHLSCRNLCAGTRSFSLRRCTSAPFSSFVIYLVAISVQVNAASRCVDAHPLRSALSSSILSQSLCRYTQLLAASMHIRSVQLFRLLSCRNLCASTPASRCVDAHPLCSTLSSSILSQSLCKYTQLLVASMHIRSVQLFRHLSCRNLCASTRSFSLRRCTSALFNSFVICLVAISVQVHAASRCVDAHPLCSTRSSSILSQSLCKYTQLLAASMHIRSVQLFRHLSCRNLCASTHNLSLRRCTSAPFNSFVIYLVAISVQVHAASRCVDAHPLCSTLSSSILSQSLCMYTQPLAAPMRIHSVQIFPHLSCRNLCASTRSFSLRRCTSAPFSSFVIYLVAISVQVHAASRCVDAHPLRSALSSSILSQSLCRYTQLLAASMHIRSVQLFRLLSCRNLCASTPAPRCVDAHPLCSTLSSSILSQSLCMYTQPLAAPLHIHSVQIFRHLSCRNLCASTRSFSLRRCTSAPFNSFVIYLVAISVQVHAASRCVDAHPLRSALSSSILSQSLCKYTQLLAASMHIRSVQLFRHLSCRNLCASTRSFSLRRCTSAPFSSFVIYLVAISVQVHVAPRCADAHPLFSTLSSCRLSQFLCRCTQPIIWRSVAQKHPCSLATHSALRCPHAPSTATHLFRF